MPKQGSSIAGTSNDSNTSRRAFQDPVLFVTWTRANID